MEDFLKDMLKHEQLRKAKDYRHLNKLAKKGGILFTGSSLMEMFPVCELSMNAGIKFPVYNRGISGTTTDDFLREIDAVLVDLQPSKVFINIGTNDMSKAVYGDNWMKHLMENYEKIVTASIEKIPSVELYIMAYYPANPHLEGLTPPQRQLLECRTAENLAECNRRLKALAERYGQHFVNVNAGLADENGELKSEYSIDGVHMCAEAYAIVFENLKPYLVATP